ncbi:hypothetical protein HY636_04885 [Candidatus Woesearchaeota archaeon]|nr:hypothetical protein [Candidatus Woesearchaeota archaeon]
MDYVNGIVKKLGGWYRLGELLIWPESYSASTIDDFLINKRYIQQTNKNLPIACFFNGLAMVLFESFVIYTHIDEKRANLSDATSPLEVSIEDATWGLCKSKRQLLKDGMRLYEPCIFYKPKEDYVLLSNFKTLPQSEKEGEEAGFFGELALAKLFS